MEEKTKFGNRTSSWCVAIEGDYVTIRQNGYNKIAHPLEYIGIAAGFMADTVKNSIMAMPKNGARKIQLNCSWE